MRPTIPAFCLACALAAPAFAAAASTPDPECRMALASATALSERFVQGDASLTYEDASDLAWVAMPEYDQTLAVRGCGQMRPQFQAAALSGLRSTRVDARALLRQACGVRPAPLDDAEARLAKEAVSEEGTAGLKLLGADTSACTTPLPR
jgi:hypothetical protein